MAWSESIDGGKKPVGAECINRLRNVSRLIGGDLVTFLNGDNIKEKWLETSYAPMKAKSRQKAILTVRRFVEYVIDRYSSIQCGSDNMPSPDDLVQLKNRLEKWRASYNKDKQKQDSSNLRFFGKNLLQKEDLVQVGPSSDHYRRVKDNIMEIEGEYILIILHVYCVMHLVITGTRGLTLHESPKQQQ